ncbi:NADH-dependent [FeFe] hydrogenase, group A6 [Rhodocyclus tenuis]|uniref:NADH-quinone oxidoreductase subunit G/[NiFe] hydrogenase diaphorase moiety small subunit n=1 Tax=Rhodocyclus tenuis TaxID=1066 RepID=A0A840G5H1_RHOTE|nr:NADH-dependent [FeFe] hydrogenase, group A6 [Rhodocyclus tenuis]MBB4247623.1 NADH-quinone oxidoreductase subunit G/[NiFe] hydrogenase diaphorase moiety small subunit [Rhodocyclus tenuis]
MPKSSAQVDSLCRQAQDPAHAAGAAVANPINLTIDDIPVAVPEGSTILQAASVAGLRIPTLCNHPDLRAGGHCRVCVVEIVGQRGLHAACTYPATPGLKVVTSSPSVRKARRHVIDLLLANHYGECNTCSRNRNCELQSLAREYGVDAFRFGQPAAPRHAIDHTSASIVRDMNKCVLCRRCVRTCNELQDVGCLAIEGRGAKSHITTFGDKPLASVVCISCGQCINRCPTGALSEADQTDEIWAMLDDPSKHVVIQTAPSPRAAIGECFGLPPGTALTFEMNTAIKRIGFDAVFDTNFSADLTIIEEGTELLQRLHGALVRQDPEVRLPQLTSCSPGWIKYIEHFYPDQLGLLSSAKSPQQMFGSVIKTYYAEQHGIDAKDIVSVALMPCTAKKFECDRPEMADSGHKDVDFALTARELAKMVREAGIDLPHLPQSDFDDPFETPTGSGVIFGATGGVMEAALRTVIELVTGRKVEDFYENANIVPVRGIEGVRLIELPIPEVGPVPDLLRHLFDDFEWLRGATLRVGVAHGTANARKVMDDIKQGGVFSTCHFIEVMACPGGCLGGGGQPIPTSPEIRAARARAIYGEDASYEVRKSHENPQIARIYQEFLKEGPGGHKAHELLHTTYTPRGKFIS